MGECLLVRRGNVTANHIVPILNSEYPTDVSVPAGSSATFDVFIDTQGIPSKYTFQWYKDGASVFGANSPSFTCSANVDFSSSTVYCVVTNEAGSVISRTATLTATSDIPIFTYDGDYEIVDDDDNQINKTLGDWKIRFLTSGTLTFTALNGAADGIDVFCVGGGGNGSAHYNGGSGGAGGYTTTKKGVPVEKNYQYAITIGGATGKSSAFDVVAKGGKSGIYGSEYTVVGGSGGSGGGADAAGGSDGSDGGGTSWYYGGKGQGTTTREFGESGATLYAGGGGGGPNAGGSGGGGAGASTWGEAKSGTANTGGGGGGVNAGTNGTGGSGIVIIRNAR